MFDDYGFKDGDFNLVLLSGDKFSEAKTVGVTKRASFIQRFEIPFQITPEWEITPLQIFLPTRSNTKPRVVEVDVASNQEREIQIPDANYQYYWEVINEIGLAFDPHMPCFRILEYLPLTRVIEADHPYHFGELNAANAFKDNLIVNVFEGIKKVAANRPVIRQYLKKIGVGKLDWAFSPIGNPDRIFKYTNRVGHFVANSIKITESDAKFTYSSFVNTRVHLLFNVHLAKAIKLDSVSAMKGIWDVSGLLAIKQIGDYIVLAFRNPWHLKLKDTTAKINWVDLLVEMLIA